ncbi:hypothetical protein [Lactobacillus paragasseri]|uniref:hypothetical protein n=1 Tax=Lactobacillus paragasseri TaxID=2107999 RepID=UPI0013C33A2A|nr:hypothetical protein [Lactobacillus paragasseri]
MENIIYKEEVCGRIAVVKEMDMPFGRYYTGYIEILHKDPFSWICSVYLHRQERSQ